MAHQTATHAGHTSHTGYAMSANQMDRCIQECLACYQRCTTAVRHCLDQGGRHAEARHVTLLLDCAASCSASADFMLRRSEFHAQACAVCAEVCRACEQSCRALADDAMMQECAEACRRCAGRCAEMAGAAA